MKALSTRPLSPKIAWALLSTVPLAFAGSLQLPQTGDNEILQHFSIVYLDDGQGGFVKTIRIEGVNLQIVSGTGLTNSVNGLGNLIIGYNELRGQANDRTGSHNVIGGMKANYSSYGGFVSGWKNTISAPYACAPGGSANVASGHASVVLGGHSNQATGGNSVAGGGGNNIASGLFSVVSGGRQGKATGEHAVVLAGVGNEATDFASAVVGGMGNEAGGRESAILGGRNNETSARWTCVAGGHFSTVNQAYWSAIGPVTFVD